MKIRSIKIDSGKQALKAFIAGILAIVLLFQCFHAEARSVFTTIISHDYHRKSWKFPSLVYSDWLEISQGEALSPDRLRATLSAYSFEEVISPKKPMHFSLRDGICELIIPVFTYPDGDFPYGKVKVNFDSRWRVRAIFDSNGDETDRLRIPPVLLGRICDEDLILADYALYEEIPEDLVNAIVACEDRSFWNHRGFTFESIIRAAKENLSTGKITQGGSSITQQLMKNLVLTPERSLKRKFLELLWAVSAEFFFDKETILELYLNQLYLGQDGPYSIVGVKEAARFYFDKPLAELSTAECALLAGIIPAPARFSPYKNPGLVKRRRDNALRDMASYGYLSEALYDSLLTTEVRLKRGERPVGKYPDYVELVRREIAELYDEKALASKGFTVWTYLDPYLQNAGIEAVDSGTSAMDEITGNHPVQSALAACRVDDGAIVAIIGGRSDVETEFVRALDAHRQPGSAFKIFVYSTAAESPFRTDGGAVFSPSTILPDTPSVYFVKDTIWSPRNYVDEFAGEISVRRALERSQNVATVNLATALGLENIIALAKRFGIESPLEPEPSLALGAFEVNPLEMAVACLPLPRGGMRPKHGSVKYIADYRGVPIYRKTKTETRVMRENAAYIATNLLKGVVIFGRGNDVRELGFMRPSAGKTGTTNDEHDSWFVGFTPEYSIAVWAGMDDNSRLGLTGTYGALPIWTHFAGIAHEGLPYKDFAKPDSGLVYKWIDERNGLLAAPGCPVQIEEAYIPGTEQTRVCTIDHSLQDSIETNP